MERRRHGTQKEREGYRNEGPKQERKSERRAIYREKKDQRRKGKREGKEEGGRRMEEGLKAEMKCRGRDNSIEEERKGKGRIGRKKKVPRK